MMGESHLLEECVSETLEVIFEIQTYNEVLVYVQ